MSEHDSLADGADLQFEHVDAQSRSSTGEAAVTCADCHVLIRDEYFDVNGNSVCARCRDAVAFAAETPSGLGPFAIASACGFFAALAGAIIYYVVLAVFNLEIGIVAVLIGYMVGYSVRKGARGGGLRFQILAVVLTYAAVALAYTPIVVRSALAAGNEPTAQVETNRGENVPATTPSRDQPSTRTALTRSAAFLGIVALLAFAAALPVLAIVSSFPSGLISAVILLVGLRQAWRMTAPPIVQILGPYRVGPAVDSAATG